MKKLFISALIAIVFAFNLSAQDQNSKRLDSIVTYYNYKNYPYPLDSSLQKKIVYTYDNSGNIEMEENWELLHWGGSFWLADLRKCKYDVYGHLIADSSFSWDFGRDKWEEQPSAFNKYFYENDMLVQAILSYPDRPHDNQWQAWEYDSVGNILFYYFDYQSGEYIG